MRDGTGHNKFISKIPYSFYFLSFFFFFFFYEKILFFHVPQKLRGRGDIYSISLFEKETYQI